MEENTEDAENMTTEDIVEANEEILHTLIDLLIEKNVISEEELDKKLEGDEE